MRRTTFGFLAVVLVTGLAPLVPSAAVAQGTVSGRVSIRERDGESSKDLATAVIYLATAGGANAPGRRADAEIAMHDKEYIPHVRVLPAGSTVAFPNQDPFRHNVFSNSPAGPFDLGLTPRGGAARNTFRRAGAYAIYCNIHSRMSAFIIAVGTPWFTQAGADGGFALADVPPGRYVLHVWHERGGEASRPIEVGGGGMADLALELDARGWRPREHKNKFGLDYTASDGERY
jgi:plastocyanin